MSEFICIHLRETDFCHTTLFMLGSKGGGGGAAGVWTPEKSQIYRISYQVLFGPDPPKIRKLPIQHLTLGHHRSASETPFNGVSLAGY